MMGLGELGDLGGNNNGYKEDTRLEDRLAMEAEEEKKYETGEGYGGGGGGGGGGGAGWEDGGKGVNWATNIQRQDAAEVMDLKFTNDNDDLKRFKNAGNLFIPKLSQQLEPCILLAVVSFQSTVRIQH